MLSVRRFPVIKDETKKEAYLYAKNVDSAIDAFCPEIDHICEVMDLANELADAGWKVKVAPFEDYPMLQIRAKIKRKQK